MNAPCARRYSLRLAAKSGATDTQSSPSCTGVRRSVRECGGRSSAAVAVTKARRSARLAKLPRVCYVGMDGDEE